ncbi:MAG: hypothetical protein JRI77_03620 [Deltaproteobacteria bacterium]|nr:hypothetical protein [Deltaproteobacteria bacterium]
MRKIHIGSFCILVLLAGCAGNMGQISSNAEENLIANLSRDLSEINLIVENARKQYPQQALKFQIIDAWSLTKQKQVQVLDSRKAKVYSVIQKSTIKVLTEKDTMLIDVSKIQEGEKIFIGVARSGSLVALDEPAPTLEEAGGYVIKLYDRMLKLDASAMEALRQYVVLSSRYEKTARIILKKILEIHEKYKGSSVAIDQFIVHFPSISIELQFKFRPF